ncbi:undecaprenyl-diphosphatase UppP [Candidatus Uhrbacteria bacterium RIFCSPHIGHO2_12_FULL_60_25]|uniref:Undecaprenyl-diphosphatase n=1 Tax=Candidatus Uhrbacteria bacterium RIFCSPHIGHO2_12_FULL_60_25 TaxID=1802399 RepID=A0A1F7ULD8_9BACT|nr:MAG: undecaprenyl-diphosphatase UppP [Candidatus Uhrbacteria bacterium RIFCSPHIGHO2_02_FULL_60_44]OGL79079.1 MAG: undecaprenyl-diphosphatase UppP [Candidatus Uhrbacteria bacterium RIFCSPHIGHO2_12_FULL_60_25]
MNDLLQGIVLGLLQGVTEFFPVSSSGHLILVPWLFGWRDQGLAFDTVLHLGTLVAVLWAFRKDVTRIVRGAFVQNDAAAKRLFLQIIAASIPGIVLGGLFGSAIESALRGPLPVAIDLAFWGIVLFAADRSSAGKKDAVRAVDRLNWRQTLTVGLAQAIALLPGTSRSGITMTGGLLSGLDRGTAVQFSFLVSIPTIAAAGGYGLLKLLRGDATASVGPGLLAGFLVAAVSGAWAIRFLRSYVSKHSFNAFVIYRLALALVVVAALR